MLKNLKQKVVCARPLMSGIMFCFLAPGKLKYFDDLYLNSSLIFSGRNDTLSFVFSSIFFSFFFFSFYISGVIFSYYMRHCKDICKQWDLLGVQLG